MAPTTGVPSPTRAVNITHQFDAGELQQHDPTVTLDWSELIDSVAGGGTFWLTTVDAQGRPHTRPVFAVLANGHLVTASSASAAKTTHLRSARPTSLATTCDGMDVVWSGQSLRVLDHRELHAIAEAYRRTYGWDVVADPASGALTAPYGAPTAGPPPYEAYRIEPTTVHAIATSDARSGRSTRWDLT